MKKLVIAAIAALVSFNALADDNDRVGIALADNGNDRVQIARFQDNWFVQAGAGINSIIDNGFVGKDGFAVEGYIGKWFTPSAGFRLGYKGLNNKALDTSNGWFAGENRFGFHFAHIDFMGDVMNTFKYNEKRLVSVIPMIQCGAILTVFEGNWKAELGAGTGVQVAFRVSSRIKATLEMTTIFAREEAYRQAGKLICFPSATAGIAVNIGKHGFSKPAKEIVVETVEVLRDCDHEAKIAALVEEMERIKAAASVKTPKVVNIDGFVTYFQLDKSVLLERERYHLMDLVNAIPESAVLTIVGHADKETGSKRRNATLSEQRVEVVRQALRELGFHGEIRCDAKGDTANPFNGPIPKNRCVTIAVTLNQ